MNLKSEPIETTVVSYTGDIIRNAKIVIKLETPRGSEVVDSRQSDEFGFIKTRPLPNGKYTIFYQNTYSGTIYHFHNISIPCYKPLEENYKPKTPFEVLRGENNLMDYAIYLQIENVDVTSGGNKYPIYNVSPNDFSNELFGMLEFFGLEQLSRITYTKFDVEFYIPLTSQNDKTRHVRCGGVPGIKFFTDSQLVVPMDYWSIVLRYPFFSSSYTSGAAKAVGENNLIKVYGTQLESVLKKLNYGDILRCTYDDSQNGNPQFYGIVDDINSSNEIILEKFLSTRYNSDYSFLSSEKNLNKIEIFNGLKSLVDASVFENFTVTENVYAQDIGEMFEYNWIEIA